MFKKYPKAKKFCTIAPDYEFGRREEAAFEEEIKRLVPDAEILYQAWPKPGEKDFTSFITAIMAKKPDAVHSSLFGGDLVAFTKQAAPYGFFEKIPFMALYDLPVFIALKTMPQRVSWPLAGAASFMDPNPKMMEFAEKYKKVHGEYPDSWAVQAYDSVYLIKAAVEKAKSSDTEKRSSRPWKGSSSTACGGSSPSGHWTIWAAFPAIRGSLPRTPNIPSRFGRMCPRVPGEEVWRSEAGVKEVWKKTGVTR